jgi:CRP-like cAMP-binding protein
MPDRKSVPLSNRLLAGLLLKDQRRIARSCSQVKLTLGDVLYEPGDRMRYVYFPRSGIISLFAPVDGREMAEVGMVGNEGMAGKALAYGAKVSSMRALVQVSGVALRMPAASFRNEIARNPALQQQLNRHLFGLIVQIAQTAACNARHLLGPRLARWLLMTHDRLQSDEFHLTQEFLAQMLGVRRSGVTAAAGALQKKKLIRYSRGNIVVLNRRGLERASCTCYRVVNELCGIPLA